MSFVEEYFVNILIHNTIKIALISLGLFEKANARAFENG